MTGTVEGSSSSSYSMKGRTIAARFRIEGVLGAGRLSPVYLARSLPLGRGVALRLLGADLASDPTFYEMFHAGVQAAARLNHPGLARVLDCGEEPDGSLFLVTEYVAGRTLRRLAAEDGPLGAHRIAVVFHHVLSALAAAHDAGIVHRALSPDNILVVPSRTDEGSPTDLTKLCDLPLASIVELDDRGHFASGAFARAGIARARAAHYLSPEQERGEPIDARSDIYAAGAVMYELLTGKPPFAEANPMERVLLRASSMLASPRVSHPSADATLARVCMRALAPSPDARYQSAREMRAELRSLLAEDNSGRYVLRTGTSVAPPPSSGSPGGACEPSGVATISLASAYARATPRKRRLLRAELNDWLAPVAALAALVAFITAAFLAAHPTRPSVAAQPPPRAAAGRPIDLPVLPVPSASPDAGTAEHDSRPRTSPVF